MGILNCDTLGGGDGGGRRKHKCHGGMVFHGEETFVTLLVTAAVFNAPVGT